jgi:hypothetical protein
MIIGDADWEAKNGQLGARDQFGYALEAARERARIFARSLVRARGARAPLHRIDLERVVYPDSACARAAFGKIQELASGSIAQHSHRTYVWASLLGQLDGRKWDPELLYVASMVHDLGLTEQAHGAKKESGCFTLDGIEAATDVLALALPDRAEKIRRAVELHLNARVSGDLFGWEAHYLQAGASFDVLGTRYDELAPEVIRATLERHPRLEMKRDVVEWVRREARLRPSSRMGLLVRLGFAALVQKAPFDS